MLTETEVRNTGSREKMKSGQFVYIVFILKNSKAIQTIQDSLQSRRKKSQGQTGNDFLSGGQGPR